MSMRNLPESLSQRILAGRVSGGRLGVRSQGEWTVMRKRIPAPLCLVTSASRRRAGKAGRPRTGTQKVCTRRFRIIIIIIIIIGSSSSSSSRKNSSIRPRVGVRAGAASLFDGPESAALGRRLRSRLLYIYIYIYIYIMLHAIYIYIYIYMYQPGGRRSVPRRWRVGSGRTPWIRCVIFIITIGEICLQTCVAVTIEII